MEVPVCLCFSKMIQTGVTLVLVFYERFLTDYFMSVWTSPYIHDNSWIFMSDGNARIEYLHACMQTIPITNDTMKKDAQSK